MSKIEFKNIHRSVSTKTKLMLWMDKDLVESFELMEPTNITKQEKIRQVLRHFMDGGFDPVEEVRPVGRPAYDLLEDL